MAVTRSLDIGQALKYPFRKENRLNTLLWPSVILFLWLVVVVLTEIAAALVFPAPAESMRLYEPETVLIEFGLEIVTALLFCPFIYGFLWEMTAALRRDGYDAPAPSWGGGEGPLIYWINGFKLLVCWYVLYSPCYGVIYWMTLQGNVMGPYLVVLLAGPVLAILAAPFLWAAAVQSAETKRLRDLLNFPRIVSALRQGFGNALLSALIGLAAAVPFAILSILTCCTLGVGFSVLMAIYMVFTTHLYTQAYDNYRA